MKRHRLQKDRVCMEFLSDSGNVGHIKEKPGKQRNLLGKQKQDAKWREGTDGTTGWGGVG